MPNTRIGLRYFEYPSEWYRKRLKFVIGYQKGRNPKEEDISQDGSLVYLSMDYLRGKTDQPLLVKDSDNYIKVSDEDILLLWDGSNAGEFIQSKNGILSSTMAVIYSKDTKIDNRYLWYITKTLESGLKALTVGMGIPHVNSDILNNILIGYPDNNLQKNIANFLDNKTSQIDKLIAEKEKLLKLLEEKRIALITQAVTKGLDPHVKMKPSGIDWLGDIPEHWGRIKLQYISNIVTGGTPNTQNSEYWENGTIPWLSSGEINKKIIISSEKFITELGSKESNAKLIPPKSVLIALNGQGKTKGTVAVLEINASCSQSLAAIIPQNHLYYLFLFYFLESKYREIRGLVGESRDGLNMEHVGQFYIPIPPYAQQVVIASQLQERIKSIDKLSKEILKAIDKLREYRISLITSAVTGKIDVRNYTPKEEHEEIHRN